MTCATFISLNKTLMKHSVSLLFVVTALSILSCQKSESIQAVQAEKVPETKTVDNELIVKVSEQLAGEIEENGAGVLEGFTFERTFPYGGVYEKRMKKAGLDLWYTVRSNDGMPMTKAGDILAGIDGVELIERVQEISNQEFKWNDPYFGKQWYLINKGNSIKGYLEGCDIGVEKAWEKGIVGNDRVIVAVIDGGVDLKHEDLIDNLWTGRSPEGKEIHGYNFCNNTYEVNADDHGTHVAGIIGAVSNNGIGISGIAGGDYEKNIRGVQIMSCQIMGATKGGNPASAFVWAANNGAIIAQNSWSIDPEEIKNMTDTPSYMKTAIDYFNTYAGCDEDGNQLPDSPMKGGVVIFAAGNETSSKSYPGSYEGCIAVGSTSADYQPAYYTNFGDWVDIAAPGGDAKKSHMIYSTVAGNKYENMQGTSMACPTVSGVAALIVSEFGGQGFTREMLVDRLLKTTRKIDYGKKIGGLVNAADALAHYDDYQPATPSIEGHAFTSATSIDVNVIIPEANGDVECRSISLYYGKKSIKKLEDAENCITKDLEGYHAGDTVSIRIDKLEIEANYHIAATGNDAMSRPSKMSAAYDIFVSKNTPPEIKADGETRKVVKKHETGSITFMVSDPQADNVECRIECEDKTGLKLDFDGSKAVISINGIAAKAGIISGKLVAKDESGEESSADFTFEVLENNAPVLAKSFDDIIISKKDETVTIDLAEHFSDQDGETLSYEVSANADYSPCRYAIEDGKLVLTSKKIGMISLTIEATDANKAKASASLRYLFRNGDEELETYPVPVISTLNLRAGAPFSSEIRLYSASGACVFKENVKSDPFEPAAVDLSALKSGSYILSTEINGKTIKKTIIKK